MKKIILSVCFVAFLFAVCAQSKNDVLFIVGKDSVTATEFINTFNKNNSLSKATEAELRDYLELYINFKLKVRDGLDIQIDTLPTFQRELATYKYQSAEQYLVDKEVTEHLITEAIARNKQMVRASHILIACPPNALPKDSLAAYNKALDIRKKIVSGSITFPEAAVQFSDDPSARDEIGANKRIQNGNKGDLGYFFVFDLIYPFETIAYNTPVGGYAMPFRTQFGFHLVWVQDKQPAISKIDISQILLLDTNARHGHISPEVKEKLTLIEEALKNGEDFATLAEKFTDDPISRANGGRVEPFSPNRRPGDYIKQIISLEKNKISAPFSSVVGWHIIKLHELITPEVNGEELRYTMISKIQRDSRSIKSKETLIEKLKKEYKFADKGKKAALNFLVKNLSTETLMPSTTDLLALTGINKLKPIATFAKETINIQDFIHYLDRFNGVELDKQITVFLDTQYDIFIKDYMLKYEFNNLDKKYPEYKVLLNEYHHGMILFEMNNERIWSESLKDSAKFEAFYEKVKFNHLDNNGNPKPFSEIRSALLTDFQNELETEWLTQLKAKYPVWINEKLFASLLKK